MLVDSGGGFPLGGLLLFVIIGIVGIVAWLTWMFFKSRNKNTTDTIRRPTSTTTAITAPYLVGLRRTITGEWEIQVNGQRYRTLEAVPDDAVRKEVVAGLKKLASFARSYIQTQTPAQKPNSPTPPANQFTSTQPAHNAATRGSFATPSQSEPIAPPLETSLPAAGMPPAPVIPPASKPATSMPRVSLYSEPQLKRSKSAPSLMPTIDLAKEIGDIVEEMHARDPELRDRSIRLRNAPTGGVEFAIDGIVYAAVDEIPDLDVQALIRAATREWERR
jgi:hypothetical protein